MDGKSIGIQIRRNHREFIQYILSMTKEEFEERKDGKWTPGQQLDHIIKSVAPLAALLPKKGYILDRFGNSGRPSIPYQTLVDNYRQTLLEGGKAIGAFLPDDIHWEEKAIALKQLNTLLVELTNSLNRYTETDLDDLCLPHPLMGLLTLREMLYFTQYHVLHHLAQVKEM